MSRLRIIYLVSLVILGALIISIIYVSLQRSEVKLSEVQRSLLVETEDESIIDFQLVNKEGKDMYYTLSISANGEPYTSTFLVKDGRVLGFRYHIYPEMLTEGQVTFAVYREGESVPIEKTTYYIDFDR